MNLDTETEEGRANWTCFRTYVQALLYKDEAMSRCIDDAARAMGIRDRKALDRMYESFYETGERLEKAARPFAVTP